MEISKAQRAELSGLASKMSQACDGDARMALFAQFRNRVIGQLGAIRNHGEATAIQVYIDRLERLSPDGESWLPIFQALHKTLADGHADEPFGDEACELI